MKQMVPPSSLADHSLQHKPNSSPSLWSYVTQGVVPASPELLEGIERNLRGIYSTRVIDDENPMWVSRSICRIPLPCSDKECRPVTSNLNTKSGLEGMVSTDQDCDMRAMLSRNDAQACLGTGIFVYWFRHNIAYIMVGLDWPLDALVYTAGISKHSDEIRCLTIHALLSILPNVQLDEECNSVNGNDSGGIISEEGCSPCCWLFPPMTRSWLLRSVGVSL